MSTPEHTEWRKEQERKRYDRVLLHKYEESARDRVKLAIMSFAEQNPAWTPEDLIKFSKFMIRQFGLNNRYLPPDFKRNKEEDGNTDTGGIVPSVETTG